MMFRRSQGRYLDLLTKLQWPEPFQRTRPASHCLLRNFLCSFQQVSKALKLTCCFMTARGDWPAMSRQGLCRGLGLLHSPTLDIPSSAQTDTHMVSNTRFLLQTNVSCFTSTPSSAPNHNSSTGNSEGCYTTVRCLRHNTDINFLELGCL